MSSRYTISTVRCLFVILVVLGCFAYPCKRSEAKKADKDARRYSFKIDPATAPAALLPPPPKDWPMLPSYLCETFAQVPEVAFGAPVAKSSDTEKETAHLIAKINHLNQKDPDGFLKALRANRAELHGLPFVMGKDCRTGVKQAQLFTEAAMLVHRSEAAMRGERFPVPEAYWREFDAPWREKPPDMKCYRHEANRDVGARAKVAALMQVFGPAPEPYRAGLAKHLATIQHIDAAHALVKLALFAPEESVRAAAIEGLKERPAKDYATALLQGFRYPLPAAARRAAEAFVKLQCKDALAHLVDVLEQPDPRAPTKQKIDGKDLTAVRELVRINHHKNCLLCHAPANAEGVPRDVLTVPVPLPDRPIPTASPGGYGFGTSPDIFVRTDITYLRQDFSILMQVENAAPWPEMQRFDFLVRTRVLTAEEAAECVKYLARQTPPNHAAARYALRELTGQQPAEATPQAWRKLLKIH